MDKHKSYYAQVRAIQGVLLGGVKLHTSTWFNSRDDAYNWVDVTIENNHDAGRYPCLVGIFTSTQEGI